MDSSNVKDKKSKISFLEQIIEYVQTKLFITVDIKPSQVVSGREPGKTCHFLQLLSVLASFEIFSLESSENVAPNDKDTTETTTEKSRTTHQDSGQEYTTADQEEDLVKVSSDETRTENSTKGGEERLLPKEANPSMSTIKTEHYEDTESTPKQNLASENATPVLRRVDNDDSEQKSDYTKKSSMKESLGTIIVEEVPRKNTIDGKTPYNKVDNIGNLEDQQVDNQEKTCKGGNMSLQNSNLDKKKQYIGTSSLKDKVDESQLMQSNSIDDAETSDYTQTVTYDRPKTARRKPPSLKELNNVDIFEESVPLQTGLKPVIFFDDGLDALTPTQYPAYTKHDVTSTLSVNSAVSKAENDIEFGEPKNKETFKLRTGILQKKNANVHTFSSSSASPNVKIVCEVIQRITNVVTPIGTRLDRIQLYLSQMGNEKNNWKYGAVQYLREIKEAKQRKSIMTGKIEKKNRDIEKEISDIKKMITKLKKKIHNNDVWIRKRLDQLSLT